MDYFTTTQVAKILGISRIAVFKNIKSGKIKAQKIGRNYVIKNEDLIEDILRDSLPPEATEDERETMCVKIEQTISEKILEK